MNTSNKARFLLQPLETVAGLMQTTVTPGMLLLLSTAAALAVVNSPVNTLYQSFLHTKFSIGFEGFAVSKPLILWINDGLMAIFFFLVGMEIKREILVGELSEKRKAALPVVAALGGLLFPALIYYALNKNGIGKAGWGIPMATDIAFSLGILALLGRRIPLSLKIFLTAFAIVDDLGAVAVIAVFYTEQVELIYLAIGMGFLATMIAGNYLGVRNPVFFLTLGVGGVWLAFLFSGVHATVAGILAAFTIPVNTLISRNDFIASSEILMKKLAVVPDSGTQLPSEEQVTLIDELKELRRKAESPLQKLEHQLHPFVMYFVMPLFAFANAGVVLTEGLESIWEHSVSMGIILGLIVGKFTGISLFAWLACKVRIAELPKEISWNMMLGTALLGGVGFTMSLFIAGLAFNDPALLDLTKLSILIASAIAGTGGYLWLRWATKKR
ncbi:MAG: Na+/H+ antiporter NhaA [Chitinophagales bacterium]|nr:Na+/H+ antiporter NhaA [Chitinophagales bacterium]